MHPLNRVLHPVALARLATRVFHVTNRGLSKPNQIYIYMNKCLFKWWWGGGGTQLFVVGEERLDGCRVCQCAVERIKGVKAVFGAARRRIRLDRVHGAARERRWPIYIFIFMQRRLGIGASRRRRRRRQRRFCSGTNVSKCHLWG